MNLGVWPICWTCEIDDIELSKAQYFGHTQARVGELIGLLVNVAIVRTDLRGIVLVAGSNTNPLSGSSCG